MVDVFSLFCGFAHVSKLSVPQLNNIFSRVPNLFNLCFTGTSSLGRRMAYLILSIWMAGFSIGSSFAPNYETFAALRFLTGMGGMALIQTNFIWGKFISSIRPVRC